MKIRVEKGAIDGNERKAVELMLKDDLKGNISIKAATIDYLGKSYRIVTGGDGNFILQIEAISSNWCRLDDEVCIKRVKLSIIS